MNAVETLRARTARFLGIYIAAHLPVVIGLEWLMQGAPGWISAVMAVIALSTGLMAWRADGLAQRLFLAVAMMLTVASLVAVMDGNAWQIDIHMYFFAALAMLVAFCDWRVIFVATATVAVHHLALNFILPALVFPNGGAFFRVVLHAVVVLIEAGVLMLVARHLAQALTDGEQAVQSANEATQTARTASQQQLEAQERAKSERESMLKDIAARFEQAVSALVDDVSAKSRRAARLVEEMAEQTHQSTDHAIAAADTSRTSVAEAQSISQAAQALSASVSEILGQARRSTQITADAVSQAEGTSQSVQELSNAAQKIGDVIKLINEIAGQTNLLALNATIEAARAGEAGKGFAVVASEVKNLATQTAKATEDISAQITAIQGATGRTVEAIRAIVDTITQIKTTSDEISHAVERQGTATSEIAQGAQSVSHSTESTTAKIEGVRESAGRSGANAEQLSDAAHSLQAQSDRLRGEVQSFLKSVLRS